MKDLLNKCHKYYISRKIDLLGEMVLFLEGLPCKSCKGLCCGPVSITAKEFEKIKRKVKSMPAKIRHGLKAQQRFPGTCIFYDLDQDKCGIYSARPEVCRAFGNHKNLVCFRNPQLADKN